MEKGTGPFRSSFSSGDLLPSHVLCSYRNIFNGKIYGLSCRGAVCSSDGFCNVAYVQKKTGKRRTQDQNVIFDVGNVLVDYDWKTYLKGFHFPEEEEKKLAKEIFQSDIWNERDKGLYDEEEYIRRFIEKAPEYKKDIRRVLRETPKTIGTKDYAQTWVQYLKKRGYRLYILSNYSEYMLERTKAKMNFLKYMDGAVFSCDVKEVKPEPAIYKILLEDYGLKPEECVFIDDREENCRGARKLGMHAVRFHDFKQAAADLEALGVK